MAQEKMAGKWSDKKSCDPSFHHSFWGGHQVTLWHGCEPVKDDPLENMNCKACPHLSKHRAGLPHMGDQGMDTGHWRCSSQLLHLSALIPPSPNLIHPNHQQHRHPRQPFISYKAYRGQLRPSTNCNSFLPFSCPHRSSMCYKMVPDILPSKRLLSSLANDKLNDTTQTSWQNEEQQNDPLEVGLSLVRCVPLGEQNQRDLTADIRLRDTAIRSNLFVPVLRATNQEGNRLHNETWEDKKHGGVLPPVSKPSGLMTVELPHPQGGIPRRLKAKDISHHHSGTESQIITDPQEAVVTRPSQSAPQ
ncbi:hypothetical protein INR49_001680 [Caranx melampygus]|nr:hypothetical protein INR49_001680 [Caranx melampygus]